MSGKDNSEEPKKIGLFEQILRFGAVGFTCFFIDFGITMLLKVIGVNYLIAAFAGFVVSMIANYIMSFRFVFSRKEGLDRRAEFIAFMVLSVIGLGINELVIWLCVDKLYYGAGFLMGILSENLAVAGGKIVATAVVMVYNFITRKKFLSSN